MINEYRITKEDFENNFIKFKEYFFDTIQADCDAGFRDNNKTEISFYVNILNEKHYRFKFFENIFYEYDEDDFKCKRKELKSEYYNELFIHEYFKDYFNSYNAVNNIFDHFIETSIFNNDSEYNVIFSITNLDIKEIKIIDIENVKSFVEIDKYSEVTTTYNKDVVIPEDYDHSFENDGGLLVEDKIFKYLDNIYNKKNKR